MERGLWWRWILGSIVAVILGSSIGLALSPSRAPRSSDLTTVTTTLRATAYPSKDLPPSRDNDAGRARALDSTPDNDTDAWQRG